MRVLRIYHSAVVDEYRQRERLLRGRHGHDVHVVAPPEWSEGGRLVRAEADGDVPVHITPVHGRRHPNLFWYDPSELQHILERVRPDVVDLHEEPYSLAVAGAIRAVARAAPRAKICVYTAQNLPKRYPPPFGWFERRALGKAAAAYPCSSEAGERLRARGFTGSLHVIPLGVTPLPDTQRVPGPPRIGFVGRLERYKGPMLALRAFAQASVGTAASFEVIGGGSEDEALQEYVAECGLEDRVRFFGALPQAETLARIAQLDVVLIPSITTRRWKEQFGRVAAQAMAAHTAVIASDSGSLREVVADAGILVPEHDIQALALKLRELLTSPTRLSDIANRGYERAMQSLSWERVADQVDEMYRVATGDTNPRGPRGSVTAVK